MKLDLKWLYTTLDCGDNSCMFQDLSAPRGMRTNGGCRCLEDIDQKRRIFIVRMFRELRKMVIGEIKPDLSWLYTTLDCGSASCRYQYMSKPSGMRTNGPCRCFRDLPPRHRALIEKMRYALNEIDPNRKREE